MTLQDPLFAKINLEALYWRIKFSADEIEKNHPSQVEIIQNHRNQETIVTECINTITSLENEIRCSRQVSFNIYKENTELKKKCEELEKKNKELLSFI